VRLQVTIRHFLARHPWVHWAAVTALAFAAAGAAGAMQRRAVEARDAWGRAAPVVVATTDIAIGEPFTGAVEVVQRPLAMRPATALATIAAGATARQPVAAGEIVVAGDLLPTGRPHEALPSGWVAIAVHDTATEVLAAGDRVSVFAGGAELTQGAIIVSVLADGALVGVPRSVAAAVADASLRGDAVVALDAVAAASASP
jgi:hypothetical protein